MTAATIITNNQPRDIVDGWDVPDSVRAEFDYVDWSAVEEGRDSVSFFQYKGEWYDLGDIPARSSLPTSDPFHAWDGVASDSFFSGILVRYCDDHESVVVGRYYS